MVNKSYTRWVSFIFFFLFTVKKRCFQCEKPVLHLCLRSLWVSKQLITRLILIFFVKKSKIKLYFKRASAIVWSFCIHMICTSTYNSTDVHFILYLATFCNWCLYSVSISYTIEIKKLIFIILQNPKLAWIFNWSSSDLVVSFFSSWQMKALDYTNNNQRS